MGISDFIFIEFCDIMVQSSLEIDACNASYARSQELTGKRTFALCVDDDCHYRLHSPQLSPLISFSCAWMQLLMRLQQQKYLQRKFYMMMYSN